jgi:hypothetical protein
VRVQSRKEHRGWLLGGSSNRIQTGFYFHGLEVKTSVSRLQGFINNWHIRLVLEVADSSSGGLERLYAGALPPGLDRFQCVAGLGSAGGNLLSLTAGAWQRSWHSLPPTAQVRTLTLTHSPRPWNGHLDFCFYQTHVKVNLCGTGGRKRQRPLYRFEISSFLSILEKEQAL